MKCRVIFFMLLVSLITLSKFKAQQILFKEEVRSIGYGNYFDSRFLSTNDRGVELTDMYLYRKLRVKKISIYNENSKEPGYVYDLDSNANIISYGWRDYYFTVYRTIITNTSAITIQAWYQESLLIRCDTTTTIGFIYKKADTSVHFARYITKVYKRGSLLNEQNSYYNERYLNKKVKINSSHYDDFEQNDQGEKVYLEKELRTDFDPGKLYAANARIIDDGFYAEEDKGHIRIGIEKLGAHPFYKKYNSSNKEDFLQDGESFEEPHEYYEAMACSGNGRQRKDTYTDHTWKTNKKGLYESYCSLYYAPDHSPAAVKAYQKEMEAAVKNGAVLDPDVSQPNYPRSKTAVETVLWRVQYEYFD